MQIKALSYNIIVQRKRKLIPKMTGLRSYAAARDALSFIQSEGFPDAIIHYVKPYIEKSKS